MHSAACQQPTRSTSGTVTSCNLRVLLRWARGTLRGDPEVLRQVAEPTEADAGRCRHRLRILTVAAEGNVNRSSGRSAHPRPRWRAPARLRAGSSVSLGTRHDPGRAAADPESGNTHADTVSVSSFAELVSPRPRESLTCNTGGRTPRVCVSVSEQYGSRQRL